MPKTDAKRLDDLKNALVARLLQTAEKANAEDDSSLTRLVLIYNALGAVEIAIKAASASPEALDEFLKNPVMR